MQYLFLQNNPAEAGILFVLILSLILSFPRIPVTGSGNRRITGKEIIVALVLWTTAITIRSIHIHQFHNIGDLSARFGYVINHNLKGDFIFPFLEKYESDETLSSFFLTPIIALIGMSWTNLKIASIILSTLIVPVTYFTIFQLLDAITAFLCSGLLILTFYFQFCDPLVSMVRFSLVTLCLLLTLIFLNKILRNFSRAKHLVFLSICSITAMYLHGSGRIVPMVALVILADDFIRSKSVRKKRRKDIFLFSSAVTVGAVPFVYFALHSPGYLFFKKRQIFGLHKDYPFTWSGLRDNILSVLLNFNYRAKLQAHFSQNAPLLEALTAGCFLGGVILVWKYRNEIWSRLIIVGLFFSIVPLWFITPGNWRGLYFTPAVTLAVILAGIWIAWILKFFFPGKAILQWGCIILLFVVLDCQRVPGFITVSPKMSAGNNQITRLYADLQSEPDHAHFFSRNLDQCAPDIAIYEFTKKSVFTESHVFLLHPLRFMVGYKAEAALDSAYLAGQPATLVFAPSDISEIPRIQRMFPGAFTTILPESGLTALRINCDSR